MYSVVSLVCLLLITVAEGKKCTVIGQFEDCSRQVCVSGRCQPCEFDDECNSLSLRCDAETGRCTAKTPRDTSWTRQAAAFVCSTLIVIFGTIGGVGGGAVLMPTFAMILQYPVSVAVVTSLAAIAGQGIINIPLVIGRSHPFVDRPLINYQVLSLWLPITSFGMIVGTIVSGFFNQWQKAAGQVLILCALCFYTVKLSRRHKAPPLLQQAIADGEVERAKVQSSTKAAMGYIVATAVVSVVAQIGLRHEDCNGVYYWISASFGALCTIALFIDRCLRFTITSTKIERSLVPSARVHFDSSTKTLVTLPLLNGLGGVLAVVLGIGSATVSGPLMVAAKLLPEEVSATGGVMTFVVAVQASIVAVVGHQVAANSSLLLLGMSGAVGAALARLVLMPWILKREDSQYLIVLSMAIVLGAGLVVGILFSYHTIAEHLTRNEALRFGSLCPQDSAYAAYVNVTNV